MHLLVYAPYGRAGICMMQESCHLLRISASDKDLRALGFFERLWQYDQVVFDASCAT
jgi:hypothetical protein